MGDCPASACALLRRFKFIIESESVRTADESVDVDVVEIVDIPDSIRGVLLLRNTFGGLSCDDDDERTGNVTESGRFLLPCNVSDRAILLEKLSDCARRPTKARDDETDRTDTPRGVGVRFATFLLPIS